MGFSELFVSIKNKNHFEKIRKQIEDIIINDVNSEINMYGVLKVNQDIKVPLIFMGVQAGAVNIQKGEVYAWIGGDKDNLRQLKGKGFEIPPNMDDYLIEFLDKNNILRDEETMKNNNFTYFKVEKGQILKFDKFNLKNDSKKTAKPSKKTNLMVELDEPIRIRGETQSHYLANRVDENSEEKALLIPKSLVVIEGTNEKFITKMLNSEVENYNLRPKQTNSIVKL